MLKAYAQEYITIGALIVDMTAHFSLREHDRKTPDAIAALDDDFRRDLRKILNICRDLDLATSVALIEPRLMEIPATEGEFGLLIEAVQAEIKTRYFLYLPPHRAKYYENQILLSDDARIAFPKATSEIRQAANAYAMGINTACVFHCMRSLEHGIRALAARFGITFNVQQWQTILEEIDGKIKKIGQTTKSQAKSEELQFLSEATIELFYFKDGWRNYVSHGHDTYEEAQALGVMNHVQAFFEVLARELREQP